MIMLRLLLFTGRGAVAAIAALLAIVVVLVWPLCG